LAILDEELAQPVAAIGLHRGSAGNGNEVAAAVFEADLDGVVAVVVLRGIPDEADGVWLPGEAEFVALGADFLNDEMGRGQERRMRRGEETGGGERQGQGEGGKGESGAPGGGEREWRIG
jgi:hypothetical protein